MGFGVFCIDQAGKHGADRVQRTGSHRPADLFGDERQVGDAIT